MPVKAMAVAVLVTLAGGALVAQSANEALRKEAAGWQADPKTMRALIARGADPNAAAADGNTPLIAAVTVVGGENVSAMRVTARLWRKSEPAGTPNDGVVRSDWSPFLAADEFR